MAHAAKASTAQRAAVNSTVQELMSVIQKRRSVRVYKTGKVSDAQLEYGPRGGALGALGSEHATLGVRRDAEPQENEAHPQRFTITSGGKENAKTPSITKGLKKDYVGDVSVIVLACGDPRTKAVYLTTRQQADREKLFQASIANSVQQMMLAAASMNLGTVWVSVREEVEPELRKLFQVPEPLRLLWVVPIGHARSWPKAKPRRNVSRFCAHGSLRSEEVEIRLGDPAVAKELNLTAGVFGSGY